jgi:hypothetical protein
MANTGLDEFRAVITDYKAVQSWAVNGAVVAPLADFILHIGAPWPTGVPIITSVVELIVVISIFHFWSRKSQKFLTRLMIAALIVLLVSFFGYLYLFDSYSFVNPATSKRYAKGFVVRPEVQALIPHRISSPEAALIGSEYKEEEVWTANSLTASRLSLLATWLLLFGSLSCLIGTFVLAQRKRKIRGQVEAPITPT